ncbi:hypothetical protein HOLleu_30179 [Holothuria leucospilota]|uniref:Uncharacterized protein n=1 Tax=Holothuria leucospilota TaxID=206669 RepID=A0A9Q1BK21_HOLLE|nr:hypothetical protein HOLleu_30179 [Holothuria leucospilota]
MVCGTRYHDQITPILRSLHWLPIESTIQYKILTLVYKSVHGQAPIYLQDLCDRKTSNYSLRSCDSNELVVPLIKHNTWGGGTVRKFIWLLSSKESVLLNANQENRRAAVVVRDFILYRTH